MTGSERGEQHLSRTDYGYDLSGNRTEKIQDNITLYSYSTDPSSNRLHSQGGAQSVNYSYDPSGNLTHDGTVSYSYNAAGRRISATAANLNAGYTYNALGQRVTKTVNGATRQYVYDEQGHLAGEYDSSGQLLQELLWLGDLPVAVLKPTTGSVATTDIYYVHADHLGTPRKITRPNDNRVVWSWESEAFGNSLPDPNPSGLGNFVFNLRFPGQYYDAGTGLHYNYFRDYDPRTGRYSESDPVGLAGGINTYTYALSNPLRWTDFFGLTAECPKSPPKCDPNWVPYYGNPAVFHCGFEGYLENRSPTPDDPIGECFYDDFKNLVDVNHSYASCGGTPDQYGKNQPFLHTLIDSGGIVKQGGPALSTSIFYWIGRGGNSLINP